MIDLFIAAYKWKFTLHWFSMCSDDSITWILERTQEWTAHHIYIHEIHPCLNSQIFSDNLLILLSCTAGFLSKIKHLKGHLGNDSSELPPEIY